RPGRHGPRRAARRTARLRGLVPRARRRDLERRGEPADRSASRPGRPGGRLSDRAALSPPVNARDSSFLRRSKSRVSTIPPVPIRPGRESVAAVAAAVVGLLLVLSGLYVRLDDVTLPTGARVARAIDLEDADPSPVVTTPEPEPSETRPDPLLAVGRLAA